MSQWQLDLKNAVSSYSKLFSILNINSDLLDGNNLADYSNHQLLVSRSFIHRMQRGNIRDPLLLQVLPGPAARNTAELAMHNLYTADPLQEKKFNFIPGLIHKYHGRVLLLAVKSCAIHCSYCFRQHFPFNSNIASGKNLQQIINYIQSDSTISEVILSGGDPLLASNNYFKKLLDYLDPIQHVTTLRIHSRVPIVLPSRLEIELIEILNKSRLKIILVTHANHPNEINNEVTEYFNILHSYNNITLLNQSVLLNNINNNADILAELSKKLFFNLKVLPYYLHILDKVTGTNHFEVSINRAKQIFAELATKLPGYLLPKLVQEIAGEKSKTLIV
jgi:EF-P beta-lysylation protein EpmB